MSQTAPWTGYIFVPEPIKRQLEAYGPGKLLEVYKRGWDKHNNWKPKLRALLIEMALLIASVISVRAFYYSMDTTGVEPFILLVFPIAAVMFLIIGAPILFQASLCIGAFDNGFLYAENTRITVLTWNEIARIERKNKKGMNGPMLLLAIYTHDGRLFRVKATPIQLNDMHKIIQEHIAQAE